MIVKITKGNGWYEGQEGTEHEVIRTQKNRRGSLEYIVWQGPEGDYNWIDECDCEVVSK